METFGIKLSNTLVSIEFLFNEYKKFRSECDLDIKKSVNTLEKSYNELQNKMLMKLMSLCKGTKKITEKEISDFVERNDFFNLFNKINTDMLEILYYCYNQMPSSDKFIKICEQQFNSLEMLFLLPIKMHRYIIEHLNNEIKFGNYEKENVDFMKGEVDIRKELMEIQFNNGLSFIDKRDYLNKNEKEEIKEEFKTIYEKYKL